MLTQIDVDSENAFYLPILGVTPKDSLLVRTVTGLNPPDIDLFIGDYSRDGGYYQGRRVGERNVVITIDLNPNPALGETVSGLRRMLHKAFIDPLVNSDELKFVFHDEDDEELYAYGYTEKFEGDIFSSDTTVQISLICPDPYLRDNKASEMNNPSGWTQVPFAYNGTAETGFEAEIWMNTQSPVLTLDNNGQTMVITHAFAADDVVYVNTNAGSRDIISAKAGSITSPMKAMSITDRWNALVAAGLTTPLVANLAVTSPWIQLHSQANTLKVYGSTTASQPAAIRSFSFVAAYWGI